jgi:hypothetical protein
MIKYRYTLGNTSIETLNLNDIPEGIIYETIDFAIEVEQEPPLPPLVNDIIVDLIIKQIETMTEQEKIDLLQNLLN